MRRASISSSDLRRLIPMTQNLSSILSGRARSGGDEGCRWWWGCLCEHARTARSIGRIGDGGTFGARKRTRERSWLPRQLANNKRERPLIDQRRCRVASMLFPTLWIRTTALQRRCASFTFGLPVKWHGGVRTRGTISTFNRRTAAEWLPLVLFRVTRIINIPCSILFRNMNSPFNL